MVVVVAFFLLFINFFFRRSLAWPHRNIWVQNVILLLSSIWTTTNTGTAEGARAIARMDDGQEETQKKRRRKETPLKKRERTGQIISQQELKEKARQNGQNLIASIFFFVHRRAPYNFLSFLVYCKECSSKHLHTVRKTPDMRCHINHPSNCNRKEC